MPTRNFCRRINFESAFSGCTALTEINYNATECTDLSSYNYVFYCAGQSGGGITVNIGANVTKIPACLFYLYPYSDSDYAHKITSVVFAEGSKCESVGRYALAYCSNLTTVYYGGTATQWSSITIDSSGNSYLTSATRYYFSESEPSLNNAGTAYDGNYWHYVDGVVTVWTKEN